MCSKAKFVKDITVTDPDSGGKVELSIFKHERGGMFAIDSSFIEQVLCYEDDITPIIHDPFETFSKGIYISNDGVKLLGI